MVKEAKDQTLKPGWRTCSFCNHPLERATSPEHVPTVDTIVLDNNGLRFPAHKGCWWDYAHDQWEDRQLMRELDDEPPFEREPPAEEQIMTEREEIAYERFLDNMGQGGSL